MNRACAVEMAAFEQSLEKMNDFETKSKLSYEFTFGMATFGYFHISKPSMHRFL